MSDRTPVQPTIAMADEMKSFFRADVPVRAARAPARLDVMGGIADYSGALVLQYPLAVGATAGVQIVDGGKVEIASFSGEDRTAESDGIRRHVLDRNAFARLREASYEDARRILEETAPTWVAYPDRSRSRVIAGVLRIVR